MDLTGYTPLLTQEERDRRAASGIPDYTHLYESRPPPPTEPTLFQRVDSGISGLFGENKPPADKLDQAGLEQSKADEAAQQARIGIRRQELVDPNRGQFRRKFDAAAGGMAGAVGGAAEFAGRHLGIKTLEDFGQSAQDDAAALMPEDATFMDKLANAVGSTLAFAPLGGAAGLGLKLAGAARGASSIVAAGVASLTETMGNAQQTYEDALKHTGNKDFAEQQGWKAFIWNLPINYLTDKIGLFGETGVKEAERARRTAIAAGLPIEDANRAAVLAYKEANRPLREVAVAAGAEGIQEGAQQVTQNVFGFNPIGEGVSESAALGAIVGGLFKGGAKLLEPKIPTPTAKSSSDTSGNVPPGTTQALPSPDSPQPGGPVVIDTDGTARPMTRREFQASEERASRGQIIEGAPAGLSPEGESAAGTALDPATVAQPAGLPMPAETAHAVAAAARDAGRDMIAVPHPQQPGMYMVVPTDQSSSAPAAAPLALPAPTAAAPGGALIHDGPGMRHQTYEEALQARQAAADVQSSGLTPDVQRAQAARAAGTVLPPAEKIASPIGMPALTAHRLAGEARDRGEQVMVLPHPHAAGSFIIQRSTQETGEPVPYVAPKIEGSQPGDILRQPATDGGAVTAFKTKSAASLVMGTKGLKATHEVVPVTGGFAIRERKLATAATPHWVANSARFVAYEPAAGASLEHRLVQGVRNHPKFNKAIFQLSPREQLTVGSIVDGLTGRGMPESLLDGVAGIGSHDGGDLATYSLVTRMISIRSDVLHAAQGETVAARSLQAFLAHEIGHAADHMPGPAGVTAVGDMASAQTRAFAMSHEEQNTIDVEGPLAEEILNHWIADGPLADFYNYPLDKRPGEFTPWAYTVELFAQSTALFFTNPRTMQNHLPLTYAAMESIYGKDPVAAREVGAPGSHARIRAALQATGAGNGATGADHGAAQAENSGGIGGGPVSTGMGVRPGVGSTDDVAVAREAGLPDSRLVAAPRVTSTGTVIGAPPGKATIRATNKLVGDVLKYLSNPLALTEQSYNWYEKSGAEVLRLAHGDRALAEKTIRLLALYSQGNQVGSNVTATISSLVQLAEGKEPKAGRYPNVTSKLVAPMLAAPTLTIDTPGVSDKILNFYRNLHDATFGTNTYAGASTQDRWMMRIFGYNFQSDMETGGDTSLSPTQYDYARYITSRVADDYAKQSGHDMLPRQVQAALWTYVKNRDAQAESEELRAALTRLTKTGSLENRAKASEKLRRLPPFEPKTINFADYLHRATAQVTWETIPDAGRMTAAKARKLTRELHQLILDANGNDMLMARLGLSPLYSNGYSVGTDAGKVNANIITGVTLTGGGNPNRAEADTYASALGYIYRQRAMAWHRPDPNIAKKDSVAGVDVRFGDEVNDRALYTAVAEAVPGANYTKMGDGSYRFLNFTGLPDAEFTSKITAAIEAYNTDLHADVGEFRAQSGWIEGGVNGEGYQARLAAAGSPGLQKWLDGRRAAADAVRGDVTLGVGEQSPEARDVPKPGIVRGSAGPVEREPGPLAGDEQRLRGAPEFVEIPGRGRVAVQPNVVARRVAADYMREAGLPYSPPTDFVRVDVERAKRIAAAYDAMPHAPQDPEVKAAYAALIKETLAQWEAIKKTGLRVEFMRDGADPYALSPRLAIEDVRDNNHLWVFPTTGGFGSSELDVSGNPLLASAGETIGGHDAVVNDVFRIVHDYFGHIKDGNGFRADGEENAWRSHSAMYSPLARRAMTTETRAQNSWLNFGPYGEANRSASTAETHYADQKVGILPEWAVTDGAAAEAPASDIRTNQPFMPGAAGPATGPALTRTALESIVARVVDKWSAGPQIITLAKPADLSAAVSPDSVGAYWNGRVYLFADNLKTTRQALTTLAHEMVGHFSVETMLGPERFAQLQKAIRVGLANNNVALRQLAQSVKETHGELEPGDQAAEIVARAAENAVDADGNIKPGYAWFGRALSHIAEWLRAHGIDVKFTNAELAGLLSRAADRLGATQQESTGDTAAANRSGPWYYSALSRAVAGVKQGRADAGQWQSILKALPGVKQAELDATGVLDWLKLQSGPVTKDDLQKFLDTNGVQVTETELGGQADKLPPGWRVKRSEGDDPEMRYEVFDEHGDQRGFGQSQVSAIRDALTGVNYGTRPTAFATYQLPGGGNYRELLLTLPTNTQVANPDVTRAADGRWRVTVDGAGRGYVQGRDIDEALVNARAWINPADPNAFRSSHFEQPNILAHIRFNERTDADGKRVLFIEELQSDWAQKGRREGFDKSADTTGWTAKPGKGDPASGPVWEVRRPNGSWVVGIPRTTVASAEEAIQRAGRDAMRGHGAPSAPFVGKTEAWTALALKRMIRYASENGFDKIAWTSGTQQADRYDLSKQIDAIIYNKNRDGTYDVSARKGGNDALSKRKLSLAQVEELVGKDVAKKIEAGEGEDIGVNPGIYKKLSGVDLKVGGEGMRSYYDKIVPNVANDVLKKIGGGRVGEVDLGSTAGVTDGELVAVRSGLGNTMQVRNETTGQWLAENSNNNEEFWSDNEDDASLHSPAAVMKVIERLRKGNAMGSQPGFDITPQLRDTVMAGQALFNRAPAAPRLNRRPDWITNGSPELQSAAAKIDTYKPDTPILDKIKGLAANWQLKLTQGAVDSYAPLKDLGAREYILARMTKGADGALEGALLYGLPKMDADGAIYGELDRKGFLGALKELKGEHDRFMMWVAGNRAERLMGEGKERLWTAPEIVAMKALNQDNMADGASRALKYEAMLQTLQRYNKAIMDIAEKTGLIDAASRATWEHGFYVPFYRMMEDDKISGPNKVKGLVRQYAFKKLKGGEQGVGDLLHNTLQNWSHLLSASLANQAALAALKAAEAKGVADRYASANAAPKGATFAMENGREAWFEVHDPFILDAISAMNQAGFKGLPALWMSAVKRALTLGVTVSPVFRVRNLMRDTIAAMAQNDASYNPVEIMRKGFAGTAKGSDDYAQMLFGGGLMRFGSYTEGDRAAHAKRAIDAGIKSANTLDTPEKVKAALGKIWDEYQEFGDRMENINRSALYQRLRAKGVSHLEASFQARDMMDFSLQGSWTAIRFLAQTVPFMNARAQGLYKTGRSAIADPARFAAVTGAVSLASIGLLLAYADDDDWKQREEFDRDTYWWFKIGGHAYRIPKPFEIGAIGTIAERSAELMINDEFTGKRFAERMKFMIGQTFAFNPVPQMFKPMVDIYANIDSFTDRPIETPGMEHLSKSERIGPGTSTIAQALGSAGDVTNLSPVQIDYLVRAYLGWLGTHAVLAADSIAQPFKAGEKPAGKIDDLPVIGDFIKSLPQPQSRYMTYFYEDAKKVSEIMADIRHYRQLGDADKVHELIDDNRDKIAQSPVYTTVERRLQQIGQQVRRVTADASISAEEKRTRLDELAAARNRLAKEATERIRARQPG